MKVLLISHGSTGDIYPLIAYGKELVKREHTVTFATSPLYKNEISCAGLNHFSIPPEWSHELFVEFMREMNQLWHPLLQLIKLYKSAKSFLPELIEKIELIISEHDIVVSSYMYPHYRGLAKKHNKLFAVFYFCHNFIPTDSHPPEPVPNLKYLPTSIQKLWNRSWWSVTNRITDFCGDWILGKPLSDLGIPFYKNRLSNPADLGIIAVSPSLMNNRSFDPKKFSFTGYLRWQPKHNPEAEEELISFLQGEKVPIINFGSVTFDGVHEKMRVFARKWPKDKKIIVQTGWAGLSLEVSQVNIKVIGAVSHDQLFKHASCVIHHGGAGTTASVLHAGIPQIIIPHIADQPFFASEIKRLGVGLSLSKHNWPYRITKTVQRIERSSKKFKKAQEIAKELNKENGPKQASIILEDFFQKNTIKVISNID